MTAWRRKVLTVLMGTMLLLAASAQRAYRPHSVLASGAWYRVTVPAEGIYKMDAAFLSSLGLPGSFPSAQLRLYGKTTAMLSEAAGAPYEDDLQEIALHVVDGGDGTVSGGDYVLFYSRGPNPWVADTAARRFTHKKNLYSEHIYYYLTLDGTGSAKRVGVQAASPAPAATVTSFDERYFHELDSVNFLLSGKAWFGEEFSNMPGRSLTRTFTVPAAGALSGTPLTLRTSVAARSVTVGSQFTASLNNDVVQALSVPAVGSQNLALFAQAAEAESTTDLNGNSVLVAFRYTPGSFNAQGWLNWFEVFYRRQLAMPSSGALLFRDWRSVGSGPVQYIISGAHAATLVWDVTDPAAPVRMNTTLGGGGLSFSSEAATLKEYAAFGASVLTPVAGGRVANQDLHNTTPADYIIITHPVFLSQAQRLARFHEGRHGLKTVVVTTDQVFNEFSAGVPDPTALRDFVKMYYDRYRSTWTVKGKYLLLLGKGSFDYKDRLKNNTAYVPVWESPSSLDPLSTYTSDDFFGFLDDHEDIASGMITNLLDMGIGRVPARTEEEARQFVDKVEAYHAPATMGPWRNNLNFVADDEDFNLHLQDAEVLTATTSTVAPV
ncbi:MAG TPA: type IX secretion system sortase PorU, partial [Chitinophagaceae bacterium]